VHAQDLPAQHVSFLSYLQAAALGEDHWDFYACTLSNRTVVYKGMLNSNAGGCWGLDAGGNVAGSRVSSWGASQHFAAQHQHRN
jgi:hypothetical protein